MNPDGNKKPRLAVTTRTLEAIIRLATAHAKLKLRKDEVLEEDVEEAYRLMLLAREEEDPREIAAAGSGAAPPDDGSGGSRKRLRDEAAGDVEDDGSFGTI